MSRKKLVLGTRGSALALRQARLVRDVLIAGGYDVELREIKTTGDRILDVPLAAIGDKALFTKELDLALLEGSIQLAVHSLKDLPTALPSGLTIAAVTEREDPRDAFVAPSGSARDLVDLPEGATVATASLRRTAQLKFWRSDLRIVPVRGNVDTRLRKLDASDWSGLVLAAAGLHRLGLSDRISEVISTDVMLPAVGQGALAVVCAEEDRVTRAVLREMLHDPDTHKAVIAERAFLHTLEGGCSIPVGAYAQIDADRLVLEGCVAAVDGSALVRGRNEGEHRDARDLGIRLAEELLRKGADAILANVRGESN